MLGASIIHISRFATVNFEEILSLVGDIWVIVIAIKVNMKLDIKKALGDGDDKLIGVIWEGVKNFIMKYIR